METLTSDKQKQTLVSEEAIALAKATGYGHQINSDGKMFRAIHALLNDALLVLGIPTEFTELRRKIEDAAQEAHNLACSAEDVYNDAA